MLVNIIVDAILVLIMIVGIIIGIKKGFIKTVARPVKLVLALILAFSFAQSLGVGLLEPIIATPVTNQLTEFLQDEYSELTGETVETLPSVIKYAASMCGVDLAEVAESSEGDVITAVLSEITEPIIRIVCNFIAFIIIFIVAMIVLSILFSIVNAIVDNGFVGVLNRILGAVCTFAFSVIICWGLAVCFEFITTLPAFVDAAWLSEFTGGSVYNFFRSFSPLAIILSF